MYRYILPSLLIPAVAAFGQAPELNQLDASPALFTVMAAINAAGYDVDLDSPLSHPLRKAVREELAKRKIPSLTEIKEFYAKHPQVNQYFSFAITCDGPPNFSIKKRDVEIPPDVSGMKSFSALMAAFYKEADVEDLWRRSQPAINQYIERYHKPVADAVFESNVYLRQQMSGYNPRPFRVLIELLAAPNQIQMRSYSNEITVVVTPSAEVRAFDIRHAYLVYLLDPLATKYQDILERKKGLGDHALRARTLSDSYKEDFLELTTQSLVKAVEARLDHKPETIAQALHQGYILAPYFAEALPKYEKQELAMSAYYKDMILGIDVRKEDARLSEVTFDSGTATPPKPAAPEPAPLIGVAKTLDDADHAYDARDLETAKRLYLEALQQTDQKPLHAKAYFGLAHIAAMQKDPETAEKLFQKTLELEPDPQTRTYSLVYLGRLELAAGEREHALELLRQALKVGGATPKAREEAQKTLDQISKQ